jgi:hypothetical protein
MNFTCSHVELILRGFLNNKITEKDAFHRLTDQEGVDSSDAKALLETVKRRGSDPDFLVLSPLQLLIAAVEEEPNGLILATCAEAYRVSSKGGSYNKFFITVPPGAISPQEPG